MTKKYFVVVLPDGEIRMQVWKKPKDPLKEFGSLIKTKKPIKRIKEEILETAMNQVEVD